MNELLLMSSWKIVAHEIAIIIAFRKIARLATSGKSYLFRIELPLVTLGSLLANIEA
jgi:hypothetical protein